MADAEINGRVIPGEIAALGDYKFTPGELKIAADGTPYRTGSQGASWRFTELSAAQFDWFALQISNGAGVALTSAALWTDSSRRALASFTAGWMYYPTFEAVEVGAYRGVEVRFGRLAPIV